MRQSFTFLLAFIFCFLTDIAVKAQITVTLGSGTVASNPGNTEPSPYNMYEINQHMQFVYTASEITSAGGTAGDITSIAWKVKDTITTPLISYNIRMKNTSATNAQSHDGSAMKVVKRTFTFPIGQPGWNTVELDSTFSWDGTSNILIDVCYGQLTATGASGSVYLYNNSSYQRRGEFGKGSSCGSNTSNTFNYKPFVQFEIDPYCALPKNITTTTITSSSADIKWNQALSGAQGYEYVLASTSGTPTGSGTFTKDTAYSATGLCPNKLQFFYIRTICGKGDTTEWSKALVFQTKSGGGVTSNAPVCEGDTLKLTVDKAKDYSWTGPNGFKSTDQSPVFTSAVKGNGGNYYVTITDVNSCVVTYSKGITVDTLPVAKFTSNTPLCEADNFNLMATGGSSYSWTGPNGFTSDTSHIVVANAQTKMTGTYTLKLENSFGCITTSTHQITVNPLPVTTITGGGTFCAGDTLKFMATGNYTFAWNGPGGYTSSSANPTIYNSGTGHSGKYSVTVSTKENCSVSDEKSVTVNPLPPVSISGEGTLCAENELKLDASGATDYMWTKDGNPAGTSASIQISSATVNDGGTYKVTGTDENNCMNTYTRVVEVNALPTVTASGPESLCEGLSISLSGTTDAIQYSWSGPGGFTSDQKSPEISKATTANKGTYKLKATTEKGCVKTATVSIDVLPAPAIAIDKQGSNLVATKGFSTYVWYLNGNEISGATAQVYTAKEIGKYTVKVKGGNGCENTSEEVNVTSLGINDLSTANLRVYPNPTQNTLYVQADETIGSVIFSDQKGSEMLRMEINGKSGELDVRNFAKGMYTLQVISNSGSRVLNIVIQ